MSKKQKVLSSNDAASNFKRTVDKTLHLLALLNDADKESVWKYWKAISSAVKIALNRNCDDSTVSPLKSLGANQPMSYEERKDIAILRIPLRDNDKRQRRLRVLGFDNHQVTDDYVEITDRAISTNTCNRLTVEDASGLRPVSYDLVTQIHQLGEYSIDTEASAASTTLGSCEDQIEDESSSLILSSHHNHSNSQFFVLDNEKVETDLLTSQSTNIEPSNISKPAVKSIGRFSVRIKERNDNDDMRYHHGKPERVRVSDARGHVSGISKTNSIGSDSVVNISSIIGDSRVKDQNSDNEIVANSYYKNEDCQDLNECEETSGYNVESPQSAVLSLQNEEEKRDDTTNDNVINNVDTNSYTVSASTSQISAHKLYATDNETASAATSDEKVSPPHTDIEAIISALEDELKRSGSSSGIHSISIMPSEDGSTATMDIHTTSSKDKSGQHNQEVVVIQNAENVLWPPAMADGSVQVLDSSNTNTHYVDGVNLTSATVTVASSEITEDASIPPPIDTQYDVVEYEVQAENNKARRGLMGRKRKRDDDKTEDQHATKSKDTLDRTCPMCHRVLTYPSSMAAHMRTHTGDRPYSCSQCESKFTTKANRDRHELTHQGIKPFKCPECGKYFTERRSLTIHMRSHTGERPFVCPVCQRGFAQKCTMMVHMDRHTNKKGHLCVLCGKAFRQKSQLDVHVKRHNREANYPCQECNIRCYTKGDLDRHMIRHTGERPFACSICSKTFTRKQYLSDHENTHFGRKPYKCSVCGTAFHDMASCHRHIKKHRDQGDSEKGEKVVKTESDNILTADDYNSIVKDSQAGKILTLEDGTQAMVTAVDTEADGVVVYHVTCVHGQTENETDSKAEEGMIGGITVESGEQEMIVMMDDTTTLNTTVTPT